MTNDTSSTSESGSGSSSGNENSRPYLLYILSGFVFLLFSSLVLLRVVGGFKYIFTPFSGPSGSKKETGNNVRPIGQIPQKYRTLEPPDPNSRSLRNGKHLYNDHCRPCHGENGTGEGPVASGLSPKPKTFTTSYLKRVSDQYLFWRISEGKPQTSMPAFQQVLSPKERWSVLQYIHDIAEPR